MAFWEIFSIIAVVALILEILLPSAFFLNFTLAGFLTALLSLFVTSINALLIDFVILSLLSIWLIRPLLLRKKDSKKHLTGLDGKYIGRVAKVITDITKDSGAISIYEERWEARSLNGEDIPAGSDVKIVKNDSLILYVERV